MARFALRSSKGPVWWSALSPGRLRQNADQAEYIPENPPAPTEVWADEEARYRKRLSERPEGEPGSANA